MEQVSRRELIKLGALAGAGAITLPGMNLLGPATATGAEETAINGAATRLTGRVVRPRDPTYDRARTDWDRLFQHYPLAIVFCRHSADVLNALAWARRHDVAFRVRSGRHSLEGWSNIDGGLVIDVSEMKRVQIDTRARTATVGAGLTQGELVATLGSRGFTVPTGSEADVGAVGATLGGGFGFLTRAFGLACDNLIGVSEVVPSGRRGAKLIKADSRRNSDFLWACRGGGGGNFGVVTSLTYRLNPIGNVAFLVAKWPDFSSLGRVFNAWQRSGPSASRRLTSVLDVNPGSAQLYAILESGTAAEARQMLQPVIGVGSPTVSVEEKSYPAFYAGINGGPRQFANWKFFSQFVKRPFPAPAIEVVRRYMLDAPSPPSDFFCLSFGGAVGREPAGGSAFPHRDALFYCEPGAGWNGDALTPRAQAWVAQFSQALRPYVDGAYVNVPNAGMANWPRAYYGNNYARLRRVKTKYDPRNVFQFPRSIARA